MRKIWLALVLVAAFANTATAKELRGDDKARPTVFGRLDAWNAALMVGHLLPGYVLNISTHEYVGHALPITLAGGKVRSVTIIPERDEDGTWWLGSTSFEGTFTPAENTFLTLGPYMIDAMLFTLTETLFASGAVPYDSLLAPILFVSGEFWPWWDFTSAVISSNSASDLALFENELHVNPAITRTIGFVLSASGLVLMTTRLWKILVHPKSVAKPKVKFAIQGSGISIMVRF